ncbi:MAG: thioredoxin [Candidatus Thermoplasmatota archaeon]|nr:thioredoxin [Candidatus Thermoplasmatota archaeon]MBS3790957.1 thioredoxin [Candidatus Thermoplasmatota archaeon]
MSEDWPDEPVKVRDEDFDEFVERYDVTLIDFWAEWCGPCKRLGPIIEELAEEMQGEVAFGKLNVDENKAKSSEFSVSSIPTMIIFKEGDVVDKMIGALPKEEIKKKLEQYT